MILARVDLDHLGHRLAADAVELVETSFEALQPSRAGRPGKG
jgi:hypothetical protein